MNEFELFGDVIYTSEKHRVNTDSLLLAEFSLPKFLTAHLKICDLCSGCGIAAFFLAQKLVNAEISAVDIDTEAAELALATSDRYPNGHPLSRVAFYNADLRNICLPPESFDLVTANPPYFKSGHGAVRHSQENIRHDGTCTVSDIAEAAFRLLKFGGELKICFPAVRLAEVCAVLSSFKLEPKVIRFIGKRLILVSAKKGAKPNVKLFF